MKLHTTNSKTISITQFRRNIGMLKAILKKYGEAVVTKNRTVLFVAVTEKCRHALNQ